MRRSPAHRTTPGQPRSPGSLKLDLGISPVLGACETSPLDGASPHLQTPQICWVRVDRQLGWADLWISRSGGISGLQMIIPENATLHGAGSVGRGWVGLAGAQKLTPPFPTLPQASKECLHCGVHSVRNKRRNTESLSPSTGPTDASLRPLCSSVSTPL